MSKVIKKNSKGYGYEYASLADLAEQGCEIPHTKIELDEGKQFLWFYDEEMKTWLRGAEIVIPEMAKANKAQQYGAALTYAFRYVTQMFNRVATGDDALVEDVDAKGESKSNKEASNKAIAKKLIGATPEEVFVEIAAKKAPRRMKEEIITPELQEQMNDVAELRKQMYVELATAEQKRLIQERYSTAEITKMLSRMGKTMDALTLEEAKKMLEARAK